MLIKLQYNLFFMFVITVLEVAIGDYNITVDKLAAAMDTMCKNDKTIIYTMKPQLDGNCNVFLFIYLFRFLLI